MCLQVENNPQERLKRHESRMDEFMNCLHAEKIELPDHQLVGANCRVVARNRKRQQNGEHAISLCNVEMKVLEDMNEEDFLRFRRAEIVGLAVNLKIVPPTPATRKRSRTLMRDVQSELKRRKKQ